MFLDDSRIDFDRIRSACAIALHMHQPLTPAGGDDLRTAALIGNLQYMLEHPGIGDNHNAPVFRHCYARMGEFIPALLAEGHEPRVMLEYSGTLLHGLRADGRRRRHRQPAADHLRAGVPARRRVARRALGPRGRALDAGAGLPAARAAPGSTTSPRSSASTRWRACAASRRPRWRCRTIPRWPTQFVRTLLDCGYRWVLVQEHTVEEPATGRTPRRPHLPHRLVCRNAAGETASIVAIVKTQGSDTKLVAQMQPWYEARGLRPQRARRAARCRRWSPRSPTARTAA